MAKQVDALSSSSSSSDRSTRLDSTRTNEEEEEEELLLRLARLPEPLRPRAQRYRDNRAVMEALTSEPFKATIPDAMSLIANYGVEVCEGAIFKALADIEGGRIRSPRGLLFSVFKRKDGWTPEQVHLYIESLVDDALRRMRGSENVTWQRLAQELEREAGGAPPNVTELRP